MAIFGTVNDTQNLIRKNQNFQTAFGYLASCLKKDSKENRRIMSMGMNEVFKFDINDDIFAMEQSYKPKKHVDGRFESHRRHIDIQCVIGGAEMMRTVPADKLAVKTPYDEGTDVVFYVDTGNGSALKVSKGAFAIFYPNDAHMPCLEAGGESGAVFKTVVKIPAG